MMKHMLSRNAALFSLCVAGVGLGSCKKEVTQVVDQAFSATYTIKATDWQLDNSSGGSRYFVNFNVPEVDPVIVESGGVLVYLSFNNGNTFEALPQVFSDVAYGTYHQNQQVSIDLTPATGTGTVTPPNADLVAKLVVIDATPLD